MAAHAAAVVAIWLDCDPGHDDMMAIILAGHAPGAKLLGVSTVAGNQTVAKVMQNALDVVYSAGLAGSVEIHGDSGLDAPGGEERLPRSTQRALPGKAVNVMFEGIAAWWRAAQQQQQATSQGSGAPRVKLVATGALTNVALLLAVYPEVVPMVEVVIMGGCLGIGNTGPVVEFNIQTDPEAAHVVFTAGAPLTMVPLEVTHTVLVTPAIQALILGPGPSTPFRCAMRALLLFFEETYRSVFKFEYPPLHDPCAVAYALAPHIFEAELMRVDIETASALCAGQTVCDIWHQSRLPKNCTVCKRIDVDAFWGMMLHALGAADAASPLNSTGAAASSGS